MSVPSMSTSAKSSSASSISPAAIALFNRGISQFCCGGLMGVDVTHVSCPACQNLQTQIHHWSSSGWRPPQPTPQRRAQCPQEEL